MSFFGKIFRCDCPITSALDVVGDKWTLVIIKLMLWEHKKSFKEFSESNDSIAPSILSNRLKALQKIDFIVKVKPLDNKKTNHYFLTEKALSLTPVIMELALWSHHNIKPIVDPNFLAVIDVKEKNEMHKAIIERYKSKTAIL
ncbi:helix-turn-helix transcriptional regulator [Flavobacteriaceae bacterium]|nr:helix-turn-helix transcriptional regulator [Flavobacteriaceae bacterium]